MMLHGGGSPRADGTGRIGAGARSTFALRMIHDSFGRKAPEEAPRNELLAPAPECHRSAHSV
jgi:hypothetical protein